ncbi:polysaccharide deacetylase family protein [Streptomyces sp. URMC 123]|uniref:polysaccharide deacetylase family protein n=1 Tax=Streptomyces sp. URMC 123 TaxID=3423403 RepID=UPI003F1A240D
MPAESLSTSPARARDARPRTTFERRALRRPWLLMYHSVTERTEDPYRVTVSPRRLARQFDWLAARGLRGVGVAELLSERAAGRGTGLVGLTFDDGYADFLDNAVPLLRAHGFTATLFALPGRLGGDNEWDPLGPRKPLLTAEGLRAVAAAGMEVGSHGLRHVALPGTDEETLRRETADSRRLLAELTGRPVTGFCYPYGTVDRRSAEAVRDAGYDYACAIDPGPLTGPYALPRVHIGEADTGWRLAVKRLLHPLRRRAVPEPERPGALSGAGR